METLIPASPSKSLQRGQRLKSQIFGWFLRKKIIPQAPLLSAQAAEPREPSIEFSPLDSRGPTVAQITAIVDSARRAPSGDNVQPFSFYWDGKILFVQEDANRSRAFINAGNVASHMALGMCLANIEVASEQWGWVARWAGWSIEEDGSSTAQVTFEPGLVRESSLAAAIRSRTVDRRPFRKETISKMFADELSAQTENLWGIQFHLLDRSDQVETLARINSGFEPFLLGHKALHDDLFRWIRWSDQEAQKTQDGMPVSTLGLNPLDRFSLRFLKRWNAARLFKTLGLTRLAALRARRVYRQSAAFGAFTISNTAPTTYVRVGQQWQMLWLKLASEGWSLQPIMGHSLMAHLCQKYEGKGLTEKDKEKFQREDEAMRDLIGVPPGHSIACLFRIGRSLTPVQTRAPRRHLSTLLNIIQTD